MNRGPSSNTIGVPSDWMISTLLPVSHRLGSSKVSCLHLSAPLCWVAFDHIHIHSHYTIGPQVLQTSCRLPLTVRYATVDTYGPIGAECLRAELIREVVVHRSVSCIERFEHGLCENLRNERSANQGDSRESEHCVEVSGPLGVEEAAGRGQTGPRLYVVIPKSDCCWKEREKL